ncbi:hypothetical protein AVEN_33072-1 [Araneus ventricosus]|uniref:Uncharacterized protein n=1 Tax=Araneus ventricosus TaxID=182803 RepID=A0A4Y2CTG7_ARAVE|nr:hypothetical protein AVEN_33072-1 [Araneus ventricosus]
MIGPPQQPSRYCGQLQNGHLRLPKKVLPVIEMWPKPHHQYYNHQGSETQLTNPAASHSRTHGAPPSGTDRQKNQNSGSPALPCVRLSE